MEGVESLLKRLNLTEAEKEGVQIGLSSKGKVGVVEPPALGKLLSEKLAMAEALVSTVGKVWCPLKGVTCKDMGENIFLFTFHQASGKRKALEDGPWMFEGEVLIMEDFDAAKAPDEYEFSSTPIWIRVANLPLGKLDKDTGETIDNKVGEFIEADVGADGMAKGNVLRVKIRLNVKKPLMRGVLVNIGEGTNPRWCPLEYEFLPAFCWTCGVIGHVDKGCSIILKKGETKQYGAWLKYKQEKKKSHDEPPRFGDGPRRDGGYRFEKSRNSGGRSDSGSLSWRKDTEQNKLEKGSERDDVEVTSPMKLTNGKQKEDAVASQANKQLHFQVEGDISTSVSIQAATKQGPVEAIGTVDACVLSKELGTNDSMEGGPEAMRSPRKESPHVSHHVLGTSTGDKIEEKKKYHGTYKRLKGKNRKDGKSMDAGGEAMEGVIGNKKHGPGVEDTEEKNFKKQKSDVEMVEGSENSNNQNAGLLGQPCESQ
jgi:hypothetical protein